MINTIPSQEREYLRDLAKKQLEYASRPIMQERKELWYKHNSLQGQRPLVVMEESTFYNDVMAPYKCQNSMAQWMEHSLTQQIFVAEKIDDDKVIPSCFNIPIPFRYPRFGISTKTDYAAEGLGYHAIPVLNDLEEDLDLLKPSCFFVDLDEFQEKKAFVEDIIGDILPVRPCNTANCWDFSQTSHVVRLMGTENMFCAMIDTPDEYHQMMRFITDDMKRFLRWQEENGYIFLNNGNDYLGSGSYCFNRELTTATGPDGSVRSIDTWGHTNSQESVGISKKMYQEFVLPYVLDICKEFGLVYYGCCEPVSDFWQDGVEKIPNLRKVSISPWCNEEFMAEALKDRKVIYSRKPSPNFLGIQREFDADAFRAYIRKTVRLTRDLEAEFIFRDVYAVHGNLEKMRLAVQIVREEIDNF